MIQTPWGYNILASALPDIISIEEFNQMTLNKYASDQRVSSIIASVSAAMRNYVGWHLGGSVECEVTYSFDDLHVTRVFSGIIVQLPSRCVTAIQKILVDGVEISPSYFFKTNGTLRIYDHPFFKTITIDFISGVADPGLKGLVVSRVSNVLSGPAGISSESAGGVSVSYSSSYVAGSNASSLLTADKDYLLFYKIEECL